MRAMLQIDAENEVKMASSVLLLLSWLWPPLASARVIRGELDSRESWVYLTSFCFADAASARAGGGAFGGVDVGGIISGTMDVGGAGYQLLLYNDAQEASWPAVRALSASCERRVNASANVQTLHEGGRGNAFQWKVPAREEPHRWFVAVAHCAGGVHGLRYELSLVNSGRWWSRHFSCELAAVLPMYAAFALALVVVLALLLVVCTVLRRDAQRSEDRVPTAVAMGTTAATCSVVGALLSAWHFGTVASRGYGVEALRVLGGAGEVCSQLVLLVLVLWTTRQLCQEPSYGSSGPPPPPRQAQYLLAALALSQLGLWVWATRIRADGSFFLLSYSTVPGVLMLLTRCGIAVYVLGQTARLSDGLAPRRLVALASAAVGGWLLLPAAAAAAAGWVPFWRSQQLVGAVHMGAQLLALVGILALYWPWRTRLWRLPGLPHTELSAVPYETIR